MSYSSKKGAVERGVPQPKYIMGEGSPSHDPLQPDKVPRTAAGPQSAGLLFPQWRETASNTVLYNLVLDNQAWIFPPFTSIISNMHCKCNAYFTVIIRYTKRKTFILRGIRMAFKIPSIPPTTNKTIRFPNDLIEEVEQLIEGKDCTFSAFVVAAVRAAVEEVQNQQDSDR